MIIFKRLFWTFHCLRLVHFIFTDHTESNTTGSATMPEEIEQLYSSLIAGYTTEAILEDCNPQKIKLIVLNDGVLWPFSLQNVVFPISEAQPGVCIDSYRNKYHPYTRVSKAILEIHRRGFPIAVVCNAYFRDDINLLSLPDRLKMKHLMNLPTKEEIIEMIEIFEWGGEVFKFIEFYQARIDDAIKLIRTRANVTFSEMLFFDNNGKYDERIVRKYNIKRFITRSGLTPEILDQALKKYN